MTVPIKLIRKTSKESILILGAAEWLLWEGEVLAVFDAEVVFFPDQPITPQAQRVLNAFHPGAAHIRLPIRDFTYQVASSGMRHLRPLLYPPRAPEPNP